MNFIWIDHDCKILYVYTQHILIEEWEMIVTLYFLTSYFISHFVELNLLFKWNQNVEMNKFYKNIL